MMERWLPDPFDFVIVPTLVAATAAITTQGTDPVALVEIWSSGFWELLSVAMQMPLVPVTG